MEHVCHGPPGIIAAKTAVPARLPRRVWHCFNSVVAALSEHCARRGKADAGWAERPLQMSKDERRFLYQGNNIEVGENSISVFSGRRAIRQAREWHVLRGIKE